MSKKKKTDKIYGTTPIRVRCSETISIFEHLCCTANNLINSGIYIARQLYFKTGTFIGKHDLAYLLKHTSNYGWLHSLSAQTTLLEVPESFESFRQLKKGTDTWRAAKTPNYRKKGGMAAVSYPKQALELKDDQVRVPLGRRIKNVFGIEHIMLDFPPHLQWDQIKELRILPRNKEFYVEWIYTKQRFRSDVDFNLALGIDSGVGNWLCCVSTLGKSFIVCGKKIKSINQFYNKRVAKLKEGKPRDYWDDELARLTEKRNRQMRDARNKAAMFVINYCLKHSIGNVIFGWNKRVKDGSRMRKKENQNFVPIPTAALKNRIEELCEEFGLQFFETEEAYTSKSSFLDSEPVPAFGEKPETVHFKSRRRKRGKLVSRLRKEINADANAAANMIRKVMIQAAELEFPLFKVNRGSLSVPHRYCVFRNLSAYYLQSSILNRITPVLMQKESPIL